MDHMKYKHKPGPFNADDRDSLPYIDNTQKHQYYRNTLTKYLNLICSTRTNRRLEKRKKRKRRKEIPNRDRYGERRGKSCWNWRCCIEGSYLGMFKERWDWLEMLTSLRARLCSLYLLGRREESAEHSCRTTASSSLSLSFLPKFSFQSCRFRLGLALFSTWNINSNAASLILLYNVINLLIYCASLCLVRIWSIKGY